MNLFNVQMNIQGSVHFYCVVMCLFFSAVQPKDEDDESENSSDASEKADQVGGITFTNSMEGISDNFMKTNEIKLKTCLIFTVKMHRPCQIKKMTFNFHYMRL